MKTAFKIKMKRRLTAEVPVLLAQVRVILNSIRTDSMIVLSHLLKFFLSKIVLFEMIDKFPTHLLADTTTEKPTTEPTSSTDTGG